MQWESVDWLNPPAAVRVEGGELVVTAKAGSDFWQGTYYGFHRDSGHALLAGFQQGQAIEVSFVLDYDQLYDQAGLLVRADELTWVKAGVEISDGLPQLSAVATHGVSDWSTAEVADWAGKVVTVRASWDKDALILRAHAGDDQRRMLRLVPFSAAEASAGPFLAAPEREGLTVRFTNWRTTDADVSLHLD
jgi:regulation of enolase protein 1 (concanavalin A-like superfamily)